MNICPVGDPPGLRMVDLPVVVTKGFAAPCADPFLESPDKSAQAGGPESPAEAALSGHAPACRSWGVVPPGPGSRGRARRPWQPAAHPGVGSPRPGCRCGPGVTSHRPARFQGGIVAALVWYTPIHSPFGKEAITPSGVPAEMSS